MSDDETVIVQVYPYYESDRVTVLIPPRLWKEPLLAEGIRKAVEATFTYEPDEDKRCNVCDLIKDDVEACIDPYRRELYGDSEATKLCSDCYQNKVEDV